MRSYIRVSAPTPEYSTPVLAQLRDTLSTILSDNTVANVVTCTYLHDLPNPSVLLPLLCDNFHPYFPTFRRALLNHNSSNTAAPTADAGALTHITSPHCIGRLSALHAYLLNFLIFVDEGPSARDSSASSTTAVQSTANTENLIQLLHPAMPMPLAAAASLPAYRQVPKATPVVPYTLPESPHPCGSTVAASIAATGSFTLPACPPVFSRYTLPQLNDNKHTLASEPTTGRSGASAPPSAPLNGRGDPPRQAEWPQALVNILLRAVLLLGPDWVRVAAVVNAEAESIPASPEGAAVLPTNPHKCAAVFVHLHSRTNPPNRGRLLLRELMIATRAERNNMSSLSTADLPRIACSVQKALVRSLPPYTPFLPTSSLRLLTSYNHANAPNKVSATNALMCTAGVLALEDPNAAAAFVAGALGALDPRLMYIARTIECGLSYDLPGSLRKGTGWDDFGYFPGARCTAPLQDAELPFTDQDEVLAIAAGYRALSAYGLRLAREQVELYRWLLAQLLDALATATVERLEEYARLVSNC